MPPQTKLLVDRLYVGLSRDKVNVYDLNANGAAAPVRSISGPNTKLNGISGMALDAFGRLYVGSAASSTVTVYDSDADGDAAPIRTITGGVNIPGGLAVDSAGNLYVLNIGGTPSQRNITVYSPSAVGNATPIRTVTGIQVAGGNLNGIAIDLFDNLYLSEQSPGIISVYPVGADGQAAAIRTLRTDLHTPSDMDFDGLNNLYVANGINVLVFDPGATGQAAPIRTIGGPLTGIADDFVLAVDLSGTAYVGNFTFQPPDNTFTDGRVTVYAPGASGNAATIRRITELDSGKGIPSGMAINKLRTLTVTPTDRDQVLGLVARLFGGPAVDGGGLIFIGGIPIPVGPWELTVGMPARRDILISLALEQLALSVGDGAGQRKIREAALELVRAKADELLGSLEDRRLGNP